jgi:2-polyprenyl-3-methyl-5-hydroxy-6-metoxy-1,4-benzoquinol methylase
MKQWYEELFENYAKTYENETFTKGTLQEVDFIEQEIGFDRTLEILDVGCGTGRHAIELAKRGYAVTGIDLSTSQLERAREKAEEAGVSVTFQQADARALTFHGEFDVVLMLCEGGFPLMETDEMNFQILAGISNALKERGKLILTTLNALYPLCHSLEDFMNANIVEGQSSENHFDLMTFRDRSIFTVTDDLGEKKTLHCNERYYAPTEMSWLLKSLNFTSMEILGCDTGDFRRGRPLTPDHYEMLVIAER